MPKIIENLENRLIQEAKKQIEASGYSAVTIRSVAKGCGVGVGTVYNYFPSKDVLLATYMLEDWKRCIAAIEAASDASQVPLPVVRCIYDQLLDFARKHQTVLQDETAAVSFSAAFSRYHGLLRGQLAEPLTKFCGDHFTADFVAEALLTWTMAGKTFEELIPLVQKLF